MGAAAMDRMADMFEQAAAYLERDPYADLPALMDAVPGLAEPEIPYVRHALSAIVLGSSSGGR